MFISQREEYPKDFGQISPCSFGKKGPQTPAERNYELKYTFEPGDGDVGFEKRCYLNLPHKYTLGIESFIPFHPAKKPYEFRFDEASYDKIMQKLNLSKDEFIPTEKLRMGQGHLRSTPQSADVRELPPFDVDRRPRLRISTSAPEARESPASIISGSSETATDTVVDYFLANLEPYFIDTRPPTPPASPPHIIPDID
ncbi:hypothetical protein NHQ30_008437 [Ciborinia camelliae]|nr:hypothetical protein NHQ30_008437 [Ciborinia camelliae]